MESQWSEVRGGLEPDPDAHGPTRGGPTATPDRVGEINPNLKPKLSILSLESVCWKSEGKGRPVLLCLV